MTNSYTCSCCKGEHSGIPLTFGADEPIYLSSMSEKERKKRARYDDSICILDDEHYFVRGLLRIPIIGSTDTFDWGVWSTVSRESFLFMMAFWDNANRENIVPPKFGYLSNPIPLYDDTMNLHLNVHTMPIGEVPLLEVEPTMHPLAVDQREGITLARAHEMAQLLLGGNT